MLNALTTSIIIAYLCLHTLFDNYPKTVKVNEEVALKWLNNGAIPSDTVKNLLSDAGVMKKFHESKKGN